MDIGEFNALFLAQEGAVRNTIRTIISDADVENDIIQELYCQLVDTGQWVDIVRHPNPQALLKRIAKHRTIDWYRKHKKAIPLSALLTEDTTAEGTTRWIEALLSERQFPTEDESAIGQEADKDTQGTPRRRKKSWPRNTPTWGKHVLKGLEAEWILWEDEQNVQSANWWLSHVAEGMIFWPFDKTLPPRTKQVIQLKCRGYNASEIAQYLGLQKRTVYDHLKRGRSILLQKLRHFSRRNDLSLNVGMILAGKQPIIPDESEHLVINFCKKLVP